MRDIKIKELQIRNFKGIEELDITLDGKDAKIQGGNGLGKTTVYDSYLWLLFNKDSLGASNFEIKPLDSEGNPVHRLITSVKAILLVNETEITLQKEYEENWTRPRGSEEEILQGHITNYYINDIPKKKSEYDSYLSSLIQEDTFKVLSNPLEFNSIHWKDRRNIALKLCKDDKPSLDSIISSNSHLEPLKEMFKDTNPRDIKLKLDDEIKKLKHEIKSIPSRIDEISNSIKGIDIKALEEELKSLDAIEDTPKDDSEIKEVQALLIDLQKELTELKHNNKVRKENLKQEQIQARKDLENISKELNHAKLELQGKELEHKNLDQELEVAKKELIEFRKKFIEVRDRKLNLPDGKCPTCHQELPINYIDSLKKAFEEEKKKELIEINIQGKEIANRVKLLEDKKEDTTEIDNLKSIIKNKIQYFETESKKLEQVLNYDLDNTEEVEELENLIKINNEKLLKLYKNDNKNDSNLRSIEIKSKIMNYNDGLARIEELKAIESQLGKELVKLEYKSDLIEEYFQEEALALEEKLNSKFELVEFKLFDIALNGSIKENFITKVNGVPFEDLNTAMKINAGLDIIKTLSKEYNIQVPIFLDNRESVNEIIELDQQIINLEVSKHKNLRVEVI